MINHVIPFEAKHLDIDVVKENIKYLYEEDIKNWYNNVKNDYRQNQKS